MDGFNCLITMESALSSGVLILGRDGATRDLASVHGTYRRVTETPKAIALLAECLVRAKPASVRWLLDRPVSNSGKTAQAIRKEADRIGCNWPAELSSNVSDPASAEKSGPDFRGRAHLFPPPP